MKGMNINRPSPDRDTTREELHNGVTRTLTIDHDKQYYWFTIHEGPQDNMTLVYTSEGYRNANRCSKEAFKMLDKLHELKPLLMDT